MIAANHCLVFWPIICLPRARLAPLPRARPLYHRPLRLTSPHQPPLRGAFVSVMQHPETTGWAMGLQRPVTGLGRLNHRPAVRHTASAQAHTNNTDSVQSCSSSSVQLVDLTDEQVCLPKAGRLCRSPCCALHTSLVGRPFQPHYFRPRQGAGACTVMSLGPGNPSSGPGGRVYPSLHRLLATISNLNLAPHFECLYSQSQEQQPHQHCIAQSISSISDGHQKRSPTPPAFSTSSTSSPTVQEGRREDEKSLFHTYSHD